jgi:hypothetical protein
MKTIIKMLIKMRSNIQKNKMKLYWKIILIILFKIKYCYILGIYRYIDIGIVTNISEDNSVICKKH